MFVRYSNNIKIENYTSRIYDWCKENLVVTNPVYEQLMKTGKEDTIRRKRVPKDLNIFIKKGEDLIIPFGCLYGIWNLIKDAPYELDFNKTEDISIKNLKCPLKLYDYQEDSVSALLRAKGGVLSSSCGSGKGLPLDAKIYTPTGWKRNGDLVIGDKVIGKNGKKTTVTGIFDKGLVDAYKITFSDETSIVCDKDHLWAVQNQSDRRDNRGFKVKSSEEIFKLYNSKEFGRGRKLYIPIVKPVEFEEKELLLDPWLLGILISDGCLQKKCIMISNSEIDIIEKIRSKTKDKLIFKQKYDYVFKGGEILNKIKKLGLCNKKSYEKSIPKQYLYNSIRNRVELLKGLFDGDGYTDNRKTLYEYSTSSEQLAKDIVELIQSLGGTAKIRVKEEPTYTYKGEKKIGKKNYRIFFKLYNIKPFSSNKHRYKYIERTHYIKAYRNITKIEKHEPIISRCITVDAEDELYVTDNFIVTHNTTVGIELIHRIGKKALWLTHTKDLMNQAAKSMKNLYPNVDIGFITEGKVDIGKDITVSTVQTLVNIDPFIYKYEFETVVVDECFPAGTKISTKLGLKNIEDIKLGDEVLSFNHDSDIYEYKKVKTVFKRFTKEMMKLKVGKKYIIATPNHPFFTKERGYVRMDDLKIGDHLLMQTERGEVSYYFEEIKSLPIKKNYLKNHPTYNFEVEDNNNYFANGILVHNCHHVSGSPTFSKMFQKVVDNISARYKFGLSATAYRADSLQKTMFTTLGMNPSGEFNPTYIVDKSRVNTLEARHERVDVDTPDGDEFLNSDGTIDYNSLINYLSYNELRNDAIINKVLECNNEGRKQAVLCLRVDHCDLLYNRLKKEGLRVEIITGKTQAKKREQALNETDNWDVIVSTVALFKEGIDIVSLDTVHLCSPIQDKAAVIQSCGRCERKMKDKKEPIFYDYVDINIPYCLNKYKKRVGYLKKR